MHPNNALTIIYSLINNMVLMHSTVAHQHTVSKYQTFTSAYTTLITHLNTRNNVETHLGKTTKMLFIWHEKWV